MKQIIITLILITNLLHAIHPGDNDHNLEELKILLSVSVDTKNQSIIGSCPFVTYNDNVIAYDKKVLDAAISLQKKGLITGVDEVLAIIKASKQEKFYGSNIKIILPESFDLSALHKTNSSVIDKLLNQDSIDIDDPFGEDEKEEEYDVFSINFYITLKGQKIQNQVLSLLNKKQP